MNRTVALLVPVALAAIGAVPIMRHPDPQQPPSIVRIGLRPEGEEAQPITLPTEPENTIELVFPWPVVDWAGRGFTPNPDRYAGDFDIEASRGRPRVFVTPVSENAHRVLHVVLQPAAGEARSVTLEFIAAPRGLAWSKVVFFEAAGAGAERHAFSLSPRPPRSTLRDPGPESELAMIRTMRLMLNTTADGAVALAAANPALELSAIDATEHNLGDFTITGRFAIRDSTTDTLGICASVANRTDRRLLFERDSWVVRAGDRVYPVRTVDFAWALEPRATGVAFLVLARGPGGEPTLLLPDNDFRLSVLLAKPADGVPPKP